MKATASPYLAALIITGAVLTVRANAAGTYSAQVVCRYGQTYSATDHDPIAALAQLERALAHELGARVADGAARAVDTLPRARGAMAPDKVVGAADVVGSVTVIPCREIAGMNKCPRCLRWTKNDGPAHPCEDGAAGVICWRCQFVLVNDHSSHPVTQKVKAWREQNGLPNN